MRGLVLSLFFFAFCLGFTFYCLWSNPEEGGSLVEENLTKRVQESRKPTAFPPKRVLVEEEEVLEAPSEVEKQTQKIKKNDSFQKIGFTKDQVNDLAQAMDKVLKRSAEEEELEGN